MSILHRLFGQGLIYWWPDVTFKNYGRFSSKRIKKTRELFLNFSLNGLIIYFPIISMWQKNLFECNFIFTYSRVQSVGLGFKTFDNKLILAQRFYLFLKEAKLNNFAWDWRVMNALKFGPSMPRWAKLSCFQPVNSVLNSK